MTKIRQHQSGPTFPWQVFVPADTSEGVAWMLPWEPPAFRGNRLPVSQHPTEFLVLTPDTLPVGISGSAFAFPWEPPYFRGNRLPIPQHPTEFLTLTPDTLPVPISGMAWWYPFDQPEQRRVKAEFQQTEFRVLIPGTLPVPISGVAFFKPWEPPYFARKVKHFIHQSSPAYGTNQFLPVPISGMAWYQPFSQPYRQKNVPVMSMSTSFSAPRFVGWKGYMQVTIKGGAR